MTRSNTSGRKAIVLASGLVGLAGSAFAQGLLSTNGTVIATVGDAVPDSSGTPIPNMLFVNSFDAPVLDDSGRVLFRGRFSDTPSTVNTYDDRSIFSGTSRADLVTVARGADQAPGMATGILLRTVTGSSSSLTSNGEISNSGLTWWASNIVDSTGTGLVTSGVDDWGFFGGPIGAQTLLLRRGDAAVGTLGATITQNSLQTGTSGINRQGRIFLSAALTGGDVTTTTGMNNQVAVYAGMPGALELVVRKGNAVSGLAGAVAIDTSATITSVTQMNDSGQLLYDVVLSTTQGTPAATLNDDRALMVFTPTLGSQRIAREGDVAPGTMGATFSATTGTSWAPGMSGNNWTRTGITAFISTLLGGDVVGTTNDAAIFVGGPGTLALRARKGDAAPSTDATFDTFNNGAVQVNASGAIAFQSTLTGGTSTTANDTGMWSDYGGTLQLVVREGQVMPGTGGSICSGFTGSTSYLNDVGQIFFTTNLSGGTVTGTSAWIYDPTMGLVSVVKAGDSIEIAPGVFRFATGSTTSTGTNNNSDGRSASFAHDGSFALSVAVNDGLVPVTNSTIIMTGRLDPNTPTSPYCFGDGTTTACPCGNSGLAGNGCANSVNASGANLAGSGVASIAHDSFLLSGTGMPNSSALYFQGTTALSPALVFGDGLRCAGGAVIRLKTVFNTAGASHYPNVGDPSVSVRGLCAAGNVRYYQVWYRNAAAFCSASTFNLSNGASVTWVP